MRQICAGQLQCRRAVTASRGEQAKGGKGGNLKRTYIRWLKEKKPEKLKSKVERYLDKHGHQILSTPPYCPKVQTIETFWANGKNHIPDLDDNATTMRSVVRRLQDGWYGNQHRLELAPRQPRTAGFVR